MSFQQPQGGAPGSNLCPKCGRSNGPDVRFCGTCGAALATDETIPLPQPGVYQQPQSGYQQPPPGYQADYQQPGYQQPGYQQPGYQQPGYQQPGYQQPAYTQGSAAKRKPWLIPAVVVVLLAVVGLGAFFLLGGEKTAQERILGTWSVTNEDGDDEGQAIFTPDGTIYVVQESGNVQSATYSVPDETHLIISEIKDGDPVPLKFSSDDQFTITSEGEVVNFKRISDSIVPPADPEP